MSNGKVKRICVIATVVIAAMVIILWLSGLGKSGPQETADKLTDDMYDAYCEAPFDAAFAAISNSIAYLEEHKGEISHSHQVDGMLFGAHMMAAYMFLHTDDTARAYYHLERSYEYHHLHRSRRGLELISRAEFVDFVVSSGERHHRKMRLRWKSTTSIHTNAVELLQAKFR